MGVSWKPLTQLPQFGPATVFPLSIPYDWADYLIDPGGVVTSVDFEVLP